LISRLALAAAVLVAGCGSSAERAGEPTGASRVERCTERFLARLEEGSEREAARGYVEETYCGRFEQRGWIYDDGALSIDAYTKSGTESCAQEEPGGAARTVPCDELEGDWPEVLDCALLRLVRRAEVREYVEELQRSREVRCDDGTSLAELGVP
jgi:hypothetical protein